MSLFNLANTQLAAPVDANAPMTQEQWLAQQDPNKYIDANSNYDYGLYQQQMQNAAQSQAEAQLKQSDPKAYAAKKAEEATSVLFNDFSTNGRTSALTPNVPQQVNESKAFLDSIKDSDPLAYWNAQLSLNLQKAGWDAGQGKVNKETNAKIQDALQNAQAVGLPQEQINNLIKINYEGMAKSHAENIAQRAGQGATLQGIEKVAPAFAAMITAGALAPVAAGAAGAGEVAGAAGLDAYMASAGLTPGVFEGAAFTLPEGLGAAASQITSNPTTKAMVEFANARPDPIQALTELQSMTPAELNAALGPGAGSGLTAKEILSYANQARQALGIGSTLAKLVSGGAGAGTAGGTSAGTQKALANLLSPSSTGPTNFAAMNMNQNPYLQAQQVANIQSPLKQHDFLADLAQAGKTQPGLADLLRNA